VLIDTAQGRAAITGFCVIDENFNPPREIRAMEMDVIPPGTLVNAYDAYDIMLKVKTAADLIIPLHEPRFAGLHTIPAIVRDIPDQAAAAMSLIENIQREDLNPLEEAIAMSRLIADFGLTHQQTAESVGRSRAAVSNLLRLLDLEDPTKELLDAGKIDMGHARALLALTGKLQEDTAKQVALKQLSVRETEKLVKRLTDKDTKKDKSKAVKKNLEVQKLEDSLAQTLGARVNIQYNTKGKGKLVVEYNNLDELDGILAHIK